MADALRRSHPFLMLKLDSLRFAQTYLSSVASAVEGGAVCGGGRGGQEGLRETMNSSFLGQHLALPAEEILLRFQREGGRESPCLPLSPK